MKNPLALRGREGALQNSEDTKEFCARANFIAIWRTSIMICHDTHFQRGILHLQMHLHSHGMGTGTDNRGETYFSVGSNPRERWHGGTRLCRWDKLTTGPRWWDTTWIIRPSTHNCVALSGRTGSFESRYLQHARFRRNRAEIRKRKKGATITFAISHANKMRAMSCYK